MRGGFFLSFFFHLNFVFEVPFLIILMWSRQKEAASHRRVYTTFPAAHVILRDMTGVFDHPLYSHRLAGLLCCFSEFTWKDSRRVQNSNWISSDLRIQIYFPLSDVVEATIRANPGRLKLVGKSVFNMRAAAGVFRSNPKCFIEVIQSLFYLSHLVHASLMWKHLTWLPQNFIIKSSEDVEPQDQCIKYLDYNGCYVWWGIIFYMLSTHPCKISNFVTKKKIGL